MSEFVPNPKQRRVLWWAMFICVLMLLFPPFRAASATACERNCGYAFIFVPPEIGDNYYASVNLALLFTHWLAVAFIGRILRLLLSNESAMRTTNEQRPASVPRTEPPKSRGPSWIG